jgi:uncharacterized Zn finger protein (UPF0148 family)
MADKPSIVTATCPVCGMSRFQSSGETLEDTDVLTCESCGLKLSYAFLRRRMEEAPAAPEPAPAPAEVPARKKARKKRKQKTGV